MIRLPRPKKFKYHYRYHKPEEEERKKRQAFAESQAKRFKFGDRDEELLPSDQKAKMEKARAQRLVIIFVALCAIFALLIFGF